MGVAQHGGFSKASQALRVPVPQVSKRIAKLENHLGVKLFQRSTRVVRLTDEGKSLFEKISTVLEDLREIESSVQENKEVEGVVRLTCVPYVAHKLLLPALAEFRRRYPKIKIDLQVTKNFVNIIEQGIDLAIRIDEPSEGDYIYKKLAPNDLIFCASPEYLRKNKAPLKEPKDLMNHELMFLEIHEGCKFLNSSLQLKKFASRKRIECDSGSFLTKLAIEGHGIVVRAVWDVGDNLKEGRLVQVLKNYPLETFGQIYAVVPSRRYLAPRIRAFLDFVTEQSKSWKA